MSVNALNRRVAALENSAPIIDDLADYALWRAHGCDPNVRWDPAFKEMLEKAFAEMKERREHLLKKTDNARVDVNVNGRGS